MLLGLATQGMGWGRGGWVNLSICPFVTGSEGHYPRYKMGNRTIRGGCRDGCKPGDETGCCQAAGASCLHFGG